MFMKEERIGIFMKMALGSSLLFFCWRTIHLLAVEGYQASTTNAKINLRVFPDKKCNSKTFKYIYDNSNTLSFTYRH